MTAPLGRRSVAVTAHRRAGAYDVIAVADDGPPPGPGQFYMLAAVERWGGGTDERPFLPRAFSVLRATPTAGDGFAGERSPICDLAARDEDEDEAGPPGGLRLEFMLEDVGPGTHRLGELRRGDALWLAGPFGNGFARPRQGRRPILVGGGVGAAPLAIWQDALGAAALVLLGFRDAAHAAGGQLLRNARLATDDGSAGHQGPVTDLLLAELGCDARAEVYACGPPPMLEAVRAICAQHDVPAQLALEAGMACGYGACFGCVVPTRHGYVRLCVDGPVLDAADLELVA
jgi:dihydroorotate dehydrogenase electron transfer subunit